MATGLQFKTDLRMKADMKTDMKASMKTNIKASIKIDIKTRAISLEKLMVLVDESMKRRLQDPFAVFFNGSPRLADPEARSEFEKLLKKEQDLRLSATEGCASAREFTKSRVYFILREMEQYVNEETVDDIIGQYHVNYFTNIYTGGDPGNIKKPVDREIEKYFSRYSVRHDDPFDAKLLKLAQVIYQELYGYNILDELIFDSELDEVACNRFDYIWIQYGGIKRRVPNPAFRFRNETIYARVIEDRLVSTARNEMNAGEPVIFAVLRNGSRVTAVRPPLSRYFTVNVRLFNYARNHQEARKNFMEERLQKLISLLAGKGRRNIAVIGEQGSGKTTAADEIIIKELDSDLSIGLAENVHELGISTSYPEKNVIEIQYGKDFRPSDVTELFFRLNRDIIIYGEVRNCHEAFEMIKAMLRQARGSLFTFHSSGVERMVHDLRQLLMQTGHYTDFREAQFDVADAVDIVIQLKLDRSTGHRYVYKISEVIANSEDMSFRINDLFVYDRESGRYRVNRKGPSPALIRSCLEYEMTTSDVEFLASLFRIGDGDRDKYYYADESGEG